MKANPGGQIDLKSVIGRTQIIRLIWDTLEQQSVVMTAERRIGKTTVIKKLKAEPAAGWVPVFQDLEKCHTATEFAMAVYKEVHQFLSSKGRAARRAKEWLSALGGVEIGGLLTLPEKTEASWKDILTRSIEDLVHENDATGSRLLFLWDELPFMLANIRDRESEQTAMAVLDMLRALRQTHPALRMIITGSIGLHHVITSLKDKNYANSPINDMARIEVEPLDLPDAQELACKLIEGEGLASKDRDAAARAIATEADRFPFYIHHIVRALRVKGLPADPAAIGSVVAAQLIDSDDPWELLHYRERIPTYYGADAKTVIAILDELAASRPHASINELLAMLKATSPFDDRERLLRLLSLMERDHYLQRQSDGSFGFRFPLLRRWWKINRGL
jgi:hypothetical protein